MVVSTVDVTNMSKRENDRPLASVVQEFSGALVTPQTDLFSGPGRRGSFYNGGVYDAHRAVVPLAIHHAGGPKNVPDQNPRIATGAHLAGTFLFGGWLRGHFGHFLVESITRLWALPRVAGSIAGIVYLHWNGPAKNLTRERAVRRADATFRQPFVGQVLDCLGVTAPVHVVGDALEVERLLVPSQLGWARQDDAARACFRELCQAITMHPRVRNGPGAKKIYVSRARLGITKSSFVLEDRIEKNFQENGYEIIYPETMSIYDQFSYYSRATKLVFAEGSALFLADMVASSRQSVAIIHRRSPAPAVFGSRMRAAGVASALEIAAVEGHILPTRPGSLSEAQLRNTSPTLLDFRQLGHRLELGGFTTKAWSVPTEPEIARAVEEVIAQKEARHPGEEFGLRRLQRREL
jgi:hypothetical protein